MRVIGPLSTATENTVSDNAKLVEPDELLAVIVCVAEAASWVGVPEISPVVGSSESPGGSAGVTLYEVTVPVTAGRTGVMLEFRRRLCGAG